MSAGHCWKGTMSWSTFNDIFLLQLCQQPISLFLLEIHFQYPVYNIIAYVINEEPYV